MDTAERSPRVWREYAGASGTLAEDLRCDAAVVGGQNGAQYGKIGRCVRHPRGKR